MKVACSDMLQSFAILRKAGISASFGGGEESNNMRKMTAGRSLLKMTGMRQIQIAAVLGALLALAGSAVAQKVDEEGPTSWLNFVVVKDDNGKPVRNASVIMHPVSVQGKQEKGGMELKTDADGKADFDGIPYGKLRVQVLATGFQSVREDFDVEETEDGIHHQDETAAGAVLGV